MKTLILAATALLSIGTGAAFAESGDGWDMVQTLSTAPAMAQSTQPQAIAPVTYGSLVIAHSDTKNYDTASGFATSPQTVASRPTASRSEASSMGYLLNWGGG
jgi:hypothetical protein